MRRGQFVYCKKMMCKHPPICSIVNSLLCHYFPCWLGNIKPQNCMWTCIKDFPLYCMWLLIIDSILKRISAQTSCFLSNDYILDGTSFHWNSECYLSWTILQFAISMHYLDFFYEFIFQVNSFLYIIIWLYLVSLTYVINHVSFCCMATF